MATVMASAATIDANQHFSIRSFHKERNYWTDLAENERLLCIGPLTLLTYANKAVWSVTGCLQEKWVEELGPTIRNICSNEKNQDRIYRKDSLHPTCTSQLFLLGYVNAPEAAKPTIVIVSTSRRIANATKSLLQNHESVKKLHLGFEFVVHKEKIQLLAGAEPSSATSKSVSMLDAMKPLAASSPPAHFTSLCGSRFITCPVPVHQGSKWKQATVGGLVMNCGQWYGLTVAHVFLELPEFELSDSESNTETEREEGEDLDARKDSSINENARRPPNRLIPEIPVRHGVYLESLPALKDTSRSPASPFTGPTRGSVLSLVGHFDDQLQDATEAPDLEMSRFFSANMDWALIGIEDTRFMVPNEISTGKGIAQPSLLRVKKGPPRGRVLVAGGVTGIGDAVAHGGVANITLPWSATAQEAWTLCYNFGMSITSSRTTIPEDPANTQGLAPGDCGAWVLDPEDGGLYGVAIASIAGTNWTYILPAEHVVDSIEANWASRGESTDVFRLPVFQEPGTNLLRPTIKHAINPTFLTTMPSRHANLSFRSCLSRLAQVFASIPAGDYERCAMFMQQYPAIFFENRTRFVEETVLALRVGEYEYARSCAQQALLLKTCDDMKLKEILRFFDRMRDRDSQVVKDTVETLDAFMVEVEERLYRLQEQDAAGEDPLITRTGTAQSGRSVDEASVSTGKETADSGALVFTRPASTSTHATSVHARPWSVQIQMPKPQPASPRFEENPRSSSHLGRKSRQALSRPFVPPPPDSQDPYQPVESAAFGANLFLRDQLFAPVAGPRSTKDITRRGTFDLFMQRLHEAAESHTESPSR
jgi:hypothetical protein